MILPVLRGFGHALILILAIAAIPFTSDSHVAMGNSLSMPELLEGFDGSEPLVALISFASTPGIKSGNYTISWSDEHPDMELQSGTLDLEMPFDLPGRYYKIFTALGISSITMNDRINLSNQSGEKILIDPERDLLAGRISGGLEIQVTPTILATPYVSYIISEIDSESTSSENLALQDVDPALNIFVKDFSTKANTIAATLQLKYDRWFQRRRLEFIGRYNYSYTDTFDESEDFLANSGGTDILTLEGRWSAPIALEMLGIPLRYKLLGGYYDLLGQDSNVLGFTRFIEYGAGIDLEWDIKLLEFFNWRNIGLEVTGISGDDISGWSFRFTFSN